MTNAAYNWFDAVTTCNQQGGYLASITGAAENRWIYEYFRSQGRTSTSIWIGLNDVAKALDFHWIDGSGAAKYTSWDAGDPNNYQGTESCVTMLVNQQGNWADIICSSIFPALCKWNETVSPPSAGKLYFDDVW